MIAPRARIKRECVFKSVRNDVAIIVRNCMQRHQPTGGFQRLRYPVFSHAAFFGVWPIRAIRINIPARARCTLGRDDN